MTRKVIDLGSFCERFEKISHRDFSLYVKNLLDKDLSEMESLAVSPENIEALTEKAIMHETRNSAQ